MGPEGIGGVETFHFLRWGLVWQPNCQSFVVILGCFVWFKCGWIDGDGDGYSILGVGCGGESVVGSCGVKWMMVV